MVKATLSPPRAFQSVKNRESGAFGGKFGKAPMQEEDHRVRSQLSPMAWPLCCQGKVLGPFARLVIQYPFAERCSWGRGLSGGSRRRSLSVICKMTQVDACVDGLNSKSAVLWPRHRASSTPGLIPATLANRAVRNLQRLSIHVPLVSEV
jgi:hypothetical protein